MNNLTVVIPTFNRGEVLLDTITFLTQQSMPASEIIIVDQTKYDDGCPIHCSLMELSKSGVIRWERRDEPSIPKAMNHGLLLANSEYVLFLDDDIRLDKSFLKTHYDTLCKHDCPAQVGQVLQPKETPVSLPFNYQSGNGINTDMEFDFSSDKAMHIKNCMAGNLCVNRLLAIEAGGFDENFVGAAYRFETEFCRRMIRATSKPFYFTPEPVLHHLKCSSGGTRDVASYLISSSSHHSVGEYYFALLESEGGEYWSYVAKRFFGSLKARFYIAKPWYLCVRILAELRGFILARRLFKQGRKLIKA